MPQKYTNLGSLFTDIADAIREKKGTSESIVADDFPDEIDSIESGGDTTDLEADFIMQTINPEAFSHTTAIGEYVFAYNSKLTSVSFPQVITIGNSAFESCSSLISVSFPLATTIGSYAFFCCPLLTSMNFPQATTIGYGAFQDCYSLISVNFPLVTNIGSAAFQRCDSFTSISFPQAITIEQSAFADCFSLASIILGGQQSQEGVIYPSVFSRCYHLTDLHLQGSYLYSLSHSNAFTSTPIAEYSASAGKFGSIYVPASLYDQYISATNWTYFSSRFVSV